jgi:hypothetical protein
VVDTLVVITERACNRLESGSMEGTLHEPAENDCSAHPEALSFISFESEGADCNGEDEKAISKGETRP